MKKRRMKTEKIKHYRANYILHLDEKSMCLCVYLCYFNQYLRTDAAYAYVQSIGRLVKSPLSPACQYTSGYPGTLVIPSSNRHAAKCVEIR